MSTAFYAHNQESSKLAEWFHNREEIFLANNSIHYGVQVQYLEITRSYLLLHVFTDACSDVLNRTFYVCRILLAYVISSWACVANATTLRQIDHSYEFRNAHIMQHVARTPAFISQSTPKYITEKDSFSVCVVHYIFQNPSFLIMVCFFELMSFDSVTLCVSQGPTDLKCSLSELARVPKTTECCMYCFMTNQSTITL